MRIAAFTLQHTPGIAGKFPRRTSRLRSGHPHKEEEVMGHKQKAGTDPASETPQQQSNTRQGNAPRPGGGIGGREFGQVIEPMQAQMASGNEGLAESSRGKQPSGADAKSSSGGKKRKAA
jgi:hypothetical protein